MVESAFGWIGQLIEWFGQFIPRALVVNITQGAVKMRLGNEITELLPGKVHIYWPFISTVKIVDTARQTLDLTTQTFDTKDGICVLASGMITYQVNDVVALLTTVYDPDNTIRDVGMSTVQEVLVRYTYEELKSGNEAGTLKKELAREAQRELKTYGIKVLKVGIKDLAKTTLYKVALEQSTDGMH